MDKKNIDTTTPSFGIKKGTDVTYGRYVWTLDNVHRTWTRTASIGQGRCDRGKKKTNADSPVLFVNVFLLDFGVFDVGEVSLLGFV